MLVNLVNRSKPAGIQHVHLMTGAKVATVFCLAWLHQPDLL